ncbi:MAG: hypothetical protein ACI4PF_06225 [Christensenellales bacterium]
MSYIERPKLRAIKGTDLAYILVQCGRDENGYDARIRDLRERVLGWDEPQRLSVDDKRILNNYCYKVYIRNGRTIEELEEALGPQNKDGHLERPHLVGDMFFSPLNTFSIDDNGHILLKSHGSNLESVKIPGGDVLIDKDGNIIRNTRGQMYICEADEFGFYPVDVFKAEGSYERNTSDIVDIEKNFLDPSGKLVSKTHFSYTDRPSIIDAPHIYSDKSNGKPFISKDVYPCGFVYTDKNTVKYFPSATALLIANRSLLQENPNATPYTSDETLFVIEHYKRMNEIPNIQRKLGEKWQKGNISYEVYRKAMYAMNDEDSLNRVFANEFETASDQSIENQLECGELDEDFQA